MLVAVASALGLFVGGSIASGDGEVPAEEAHSEQRTELPGQRTATSNTFRLPSGELQTDLYESPVNYRDAEGKWEPIREELEETPSGAITNGANSFDVRLPESLDSESIRVSTGEGWVSERPIGIRTEAAELAGAVASYESPAAGVSLQFTGIANGLKEDVVLEEPSAPSTVHFLLEASSGLTPTIDEMGAIDFRDPEGRLVSQLPAPLMADSSPSPATGNVHYSLESAGASRWQLAVEADREWLEDPARVFPVKIDPTVTVSTPSLDCLITNNGLLIERSMCGSSGYSLAVKALYRSSGVDDYYRSLLRFNLESIPAKSSITSAKIGIYSPTEARNTSEVQLSDADKTWTNSVRWKYYSGTSKWTTEGGDHGQYLAPPIAVKTSERGAKAGWWEFQGSRLAWLVQRWLTGEVPNQGVLVKLGAEEKTHVCCIERSVEFSSSAGANKPYLTVEYIPPAPADSKVTSPTDGTTTAKRFLLTTAWEHGGPVEGVTFQYKGLEGWRNIAEGEVTDQNGQAVKWPYPVGFEERQNKPLYWNASGLVSTSQTANLQIRAVLAGPLGANGYTKPVAVEVNKNVGGYKDAATTVGPGELDLLTGNFTVSQTDVEIPGFAGALEFSRSLSSREAAVESKGVLGPGWTPGSPMEEAGGADWSSVTIESETENFEGESFTYKWAALRNPEGEEIDFEEGEHGEFITPSEITGNVLYRLNANEIAFTDSDGNRTVFSNFGSGNQYLPISVAQTGGPGNKTRMIYELPESGKRRLKEIIAPAAEGITCSDELATTTNGCHALTFKYENLAGHFEEAKWRLTAITYFSPGSGGPWEVAKYAYDAEGRLTEEWDPRISPVLKEAYTYTTGNQIKTITPPGQEPWTMEYGALGGEFNGGRLFNVKRPSLVEGTPTAQTTIAYNVPIAGGVTGLENMSSERVAKWGQKDLPADATAVFPASEVPSSPPTAYTRAAVYYMDAEGQISNVASPVVPGSSGLSITTTETDRFGNVVRELGAQNRVTALAAGAGSVAKSEELDTQFHYTADGTEMTEEIGPLHQVRLESGASIEARSFRSVQYDKEEPEPGLGEPKAHVPTTETTGALNGGKVSDQHTTEYRYNWTLRKPKETIVDPEGLKIRSVIVYDEKSGKETETRQPKNPEGGGAGTTKTIYYSAGRSGECVSNIYAGLPCKIAPAAQPGTEGQPQLLVKQFLSYNQLGEPLEVRESPGGGSENLRTIVFTYDAGGRQTSKKVTGGGSALPKVETTYGSTTGMPASEKFVCNASEESCTAFDSQEVKVSYDKLGRPYSYEDADGNKTETTYDLMNRPVTTTDAKGSQTLRYDSVSGLPVELEDSGAGIFTASYNADGSMVKRTLPDGLTAETAYSAIGAPTSLTYTKASNCGGSCTWLSFGLEESIEGQVRKETGTQGTREYGYDKAGRLTLAQETPTGGSCTTRNYAYDEDSNRTEMTTRAPEISGACSSSGGAVQKYTYDAADRLVGNGIVYDSFGRITSLPGVYAGGKTLETSYFSNEMVATQSQGGVTNTFGLDASGRQRQRLQAGGLAGTEIYHYDGSSDAPAWTARGSIWTRNITGLGGELAAIQESGSEPLLQLTNLHGDVVATAALSPSVTKLQSASSFDEFGNPVSGEAGRFGWLGGKERRTELPSGVIQMGARSYVPEIGRFISTDAVPGGSASAYDYADQDPMNNFDISGEEVCLAKVRNACHPHSGSHHHVKVHEPTLEFGGCKIYPGPAWGQDYPGNEHAIVGSFTYSCKDPVIVAGFYSTPQGPGGIVSHSRRRSGTLEFGARWTGPKTVEYCVYIEGDERCGPVKWVPIQ